MIIPDVKAKIFCLYVSLETCGQGKMLARRIIIAVT
jgi:hypothetical protein